ncbi:hypothetical protein EJ08DRAFT_654351 [Tothia fuscella]|uniref:F-box domain-containing protein n=1 Tax=Tothia fuscella TaxID=1048955 RepID=A0A9P4NF66_9PEZI|nr:hypothetical protein EJ08DRAFT_654351 [Tothia fuscella]
MIPTFLNIPLEIRESIYSYLDRPRHILWLKSWESQKLLGAKNPPPQKCFLICKQITAELDSYVHIHHPFRLLVSPSTTSLLKRIDYTREAAKSVSNFHYPHFHHITHLEIVLQKPTAHHSAYSIDPFISLFLNRATNLRTLVISFEYVPAAEDYHYYSTNYWFTEHVCPVLKPIAQLPRAFIVEAGFARNSCEERSSDTDGDLDFPDCHSEGHSDLVESDSELLSTKADLLDRSFSRTAYQWIWFLETVVKVNKLRGWADKRRYCIAGANIDSVWYS